VCRPFALSSRRQESGDPLTHTRTKSRSFSSHRFLMATSFGHLPLGPITSVGLSSRCVSHQVSNADRFPTVSPRVNDFGGVFKQPPQVPLQEARHEPPQTPPSFPYFGHHPIPTLHRTFRWTSNRFTSLSGDGRQPRPYLEEPNRVKGERAHPFHRRLSHTCSNSGLGEDT